MVDAYLLESKVAHLPRVVVDSKVKELLRPTFEEERLQTASDGICYIDPFAFNSSADGAEELAADGNDPKYIFLRNANALRAVGSNRAFPRCQGEMDMDDFPLQESCGSPCKSTESAMPVSSRAERNVPPNSLERTLSRCALQRRSSAR